MSETVYTNTGAPQGCALSPALFTIYTSDSRSPGEDILQVKFADDTSLSGLITDCEDPYRKAVESLVSWCDDNNLILNVSKTKEMIIDFRKRADDLSPLHIKGQEVERVEEYKYLGSIIDNKLSWSANTSALLKKGNQRLFFMKKLKSFEVSPRLLELFYKAIVEPTITFNSLCFYNNMKEHDKARLSKITKAAGKLIGKPVTDLQTHYTSKAVKRLGAIRKDQDHPLSKELEKNVSSRSGRLCSFSAKTNRFKNSFLPTAVRLQNATRS